MATLRDPLLEHHQQQQQQQHRHGNGRAETIAGSVLAACAKLGGRSSYSQRRALWRQKSRKEDQERESDSIFSRVGAPVVRIFNRFIEELKSFSFPAKAGIAAAICSLCCFVPGPLAFLNKNGNWAVVTADVVLEANVGLTFSKGINRTLGTLAASMLALLVNFLAPMCGKFEPYFVIFWVFLGGAVATMFKFRQPFKDRWNYAVAMSMITFHILILSKSEYSDKIKSPLIRLVTILVGFFTASLVNLLIQPTFAGSTINELVAKNFERAGNVMQHCVTGYCEGTVLEQVPDILAGKSEDDNIHMSFHEIVAADSEVDKLLKAVPFEPCHGKFFFRYPWDVFEDITDNLRYTLYDVVALDSCLRAEIQAPMHLRRIFEEEFLCIGNHCAQVFRLLGESIRTMKHVRCLPPMQRAEEGALLLQHKIAKYSSSLLGGGGTIEHEVAGKDPEAHKAKDAFEETISASFQEAIDDPAHTTPDYFANQQQHPVERSDSNRSTDSVHSSVHSVHSHSRRGHLTDGHEEFLQRRESMSRSWDSTVQRISALSLIKFASLLIELVAKAKYVASIVDELEVKARFEEDDGSSTASNTAWQGSNTASNTAWQGSEQA